MNTHTHTSLESGVWIENERFMSETEKRAACDAAHALINAAGFTPEEAHAARLAEIDGREFNAAAARAWEDAERVALKDAPSESAILALR